MASEDWYPGVGNDPIDTSGKYIDSSGAVQYGGDADIDLSDLAKLYASRKGRRSIEDIYMENRRYNKMLTDEAFERSLGWDMEGPAGSTSFDKDTKEMLAEFSPEMQQLYDGWLRAEQRAGDELAAYDIDERTAKKIGMFRSANAQEERRQRQELDALNLSQGTGGTIAYWKEKALEDAINQNYLNFTANVAHPLSLAERGLLSAEQLAFGNAAIDAPRTLMRQLELGMASGQGSHTGVNMEGNALASMALADTKAGYWSGLLGGMSNYGGGSSTTGGSGGTTPSGAAGSTNPYGSSIMSSLIPGLLGGFF